MKQNERRIHAIQSLFLKMFPENFNVNISNNGDILKHSLFKFLSNINCEIFQIVYVLEKTGVYYFELFSFVMRLTLHCDFVALVRMFIVH